MFIFVIRSKFTVNSLALLFEPACTHVSRWRNTCRSCSRCPAYLNSSLFF